MKNWDNMSLEEKMLIVLRISQGTATDDEIMLARQVAR